MSRATAALASRNEHYLAGREHAAAGQSIELTNAGHRLADIHAWHRFRSQLPQALAGLDNHALNRWSLTGGAGLGNGTGGGVTLTAGLSPTGTGGAVTLQTGTGLLTSRQHERLDTLFAGDAHVEVQTTWSVYQAMIAAYREPDRRHARRLMQAVIDSLSADVPKALKELARLGRTLKKRSADVLAYFDRPGTSNGPTEAINGRLELLRGSALGFRNLTNYIARSLLETGGFRPRLHPRL